MSTQSSYILKSDTPVSTKEQDAFQRYSYAVRISETIINHNQVSSLVVAVYAKWGEGKTSVLNFIGNELSKRDDIIVVEFNPWMYSADDQLMLSFFNLLASGLKKSLKRKGEKIGKALNEYAGIIGLLGTLTGIPNSKEAIRLLGKKLSEKSLENYKTIVSNFLQESGNKVVVFIDDIDRLTIQEVQSVFRMIKLVADFKNTVYVLSFDDEKVAKSLNPIFAEGGHSYLEKIVQLPLRLPKAQLAALKNHAYSALNNALDSIEININEEESRRFNEIFSDYFINSIDNPRFSVRYSNSVFFSIPLLKGEVNIVDLMIIEAVKVLYPELYGFIRDNSEIFFRNYDYGTRSYDRETAVKEDTKARINDFFVKNPGLRKNNILDLLKSLFPQLKQVYDNMSYNDRIWGEWYVAKRICSGEYFSRYFSYVVIQGQLSDIQFHEIVNQISSKDYVDYQDELSGKLKGINMNDFALKLQNLHKTFDEPIKYTLALNLSLLGESFPNTVSILRIGDVFWWMARIIKMCIEDQPDKEDKLKLTEELMRRAQPLDFAFEIKHTLRKKRDESWEDAIFNEQEFRTISLILYERVRKQHSLKDSLNILEEMNFEDLVLIGAKIDQDKIKNELKELIQEDEKEFLRVLYAFSSTIHSSSDPEPYKADFNQQHYDNLKEAIDLDYFYGKSIELFGDNSGTNRQFDHERLSDNELVGFFQRVHLKNIGNKGV